MAHRGFYWGRLGPILELLQPVRRVDGTEIGTVMALIFGESEVALVRWGGESTFEAVEDLIEVPTRTV
jgi:hypothetical protein